MSESCGYPSSVVDMVFCSASSSNSLVTDTLGSKLGYSELMSKASRVARVLAEKHKAWANTVAIAPINSVDFLVAIIASWMTASVAAIIDPLSHSMDLEQQLTQIKPRLVITSRDFATRHCDVAEKTRARCLLAEKLLEEAGAGTSWEHYYRPRGWDDALIYFYAGIAGRTMPVIHTHSGVAASAYTVIQHYNLDSDDKVLVVAPISHALGLQISLLAGVAAGAAIGLYTRTKSLDPSHAAATMRDLNPSLVLAAPGFFKALLEAGYSGNPGLRYPVSAGAPLPRSLQEEWRKITGVELLQLYGMTEAAPVSATLPGENPLGSIGKPMPGIEVRLDNGGNIGELLVRGPVVMKGYSEPEESRRAFTRDGWLRTGDIIEIRDGFLYFRGVKKRMIKYKGYPVFPRDLELVLEQHPAVSKAVVRGEPREDVGQIPVAEIWLRPGAEASEKELLEWVNSRVAPYKRIRKIVLRREEA